MSNNRVLPNDGSTVPIVAPIVRWIPLGYSQLTNLASSSGLASGSLGVIPIDTLMALIQVEAVGVRYRDDGTAPTATVGMPLSPGQEFASTITDFTKLKFIQQSAGAILNVSFYK